MKNYNFQESLNYALEGIVHVLKTQRNMKIHFILASLVLLGSLFLEITKIELLILVFAICFVIAMEMINTSIEVIVNMIAGEYSFKAKIAKNIAAGAVILSAINAFLVGYLIFMDRLSDFSLERLNMIRHQPYHLIFITLSLLFIIIISLKAWNKRGTPLEGGMPSGHSALAFSIMTMIIFLTKNIFLSSLVFTMAMIVAWSRVRSRVHNVIEVIIGALIGTVITAIIFLLL